ncbi:MAG: YihY/virulence factor BrkB family protein [Planctomycetota bacterium]
MIRRIWNLIAETFRIWAQSRSSQMSAALAFYAMLSVAPTLVIAIAVAGWAFDDQLVEQKIVSTVTQVTTPDIAQIIADVISRAKAPETGVIAGSISIGILLLAASGVFTQLYDTFNLIWHVDRPKRGFWFTLQTRLIGIVMVLLVGLMLIIALVFQSIVGHLSHWMEDYPSLVTWISRTDRSMTFLLMPVVFSIMFWIFPATKISLTDVIPAGFLTAFMVAGSRYFIQLYVGYSSTSEVYGAMGGLVVMLIWIYLMGMIVFLGASFGCAWSHHFGSRQDDAEQYALSMPNSNQLESTEDTPIVPQRRDDAADTIEQQPTAQKPEPSSLPKIEDSSAGPTFEQSNSANPILETSTSAKEKPVESKPKKPLPEVIMPDQLQEPTPNSTSHPQAAANHTETSPPREN